MIMSRNYKDGSQHFKDVLLEFLNGEPVNFTLDDTNEWQTIEFEGIGTDIITNYLNISVVSVYRNNDDGFAELKVFGHATGMGYNDQVTRHYCYIPTLDVKI